MHQHALEPGALGGPPPGGAYSADAKRLAVAVEHVQPAPHRPALLEQCLQGWREPEGKHPWLAALRARLLQPDDAALPVHR